MSYFNNPARKINIKFNKFFIFSKLNKYVFLKIKDSKVLFIIK